MCADLWRLVICSLVWSPQCWRRARFHHSGSPLRPHLLSPGHHWCVLHTKSFDVFSAWYKWDHLALWAPAFWGWLILLSRVALGISRFPPHINSSLIFMVWTYHRELKGHSGCFQVYDNCTKAIFWYLCGRKFSFLCNKCPGLWLLGLIVSKFGFSKQVLQ